MYRYYSKYTKFNIVRITNTIRLFKYFKNLSPKSTFSSSRDSESISTANQENIMAGDKVKVKMVNSCLIPHIKPDTVGDDRWGSMHRRYVSEAKSSEAEVLFLGDSIIQHMQFTTLWMEKINPLHCLNFGIGGDRIEHILWRIHDGELDFTVPVKAVVLLVGTNNTDCSPQNIFDGICEIVKVIKQKLKDVIIILPTLLPRGQNPNANRERNLEVNKLLMNNFQQNSDTKCDSFLQVNVHVVPIHEDVIQSDQTISHYIMYDYLHLTNQGYSKIFKPVYEKLESVLHAKNASD